MRIDESHGAFSTTTPTRIDGQRGDDTILAGSGAETLIGGDGGDVIDGNGGQDRVNLGSGDDRFNWDPGDGSDVIEGQAGHDAMTFNGSNANEQFDLSANYGKTEQVMVHPFRCLWYEAFGQQPVQVVIIQDASKPSGYELALVSTDVQASAAQLIERYSERWPTEVAYEEGKELFRGRRGSQPRRASGQAHRPVPVPRDVADIHLVRPLTPPPRRRPRAPRTPPLVSHQDHTLVRRHARQAPPRDHRLPISPRSGVRAHTPRNREGPASVGGRRTLTCKSREWKGEPEIMHASTPNPILKRLDVFVGEWEIRALIGG